MSKDDQELLEAYTSAAITHQQASAKGDHRRANQAYDELSRVVAALRDRGPRSLDKLRELFENETMAVQGWAAAHSLEFAPEEATKVLRRISAGPPSLERLSAEMVLREWEAGRLHLG